jgi:hypothetical protein
VPQYKVDLTTATHTSDCGCLDLPNHQAAQKEAEEIAYDLLDDPDGDWRSWTIRVTETGRHVASVRIDDLLNVRRLRRHRSR